MKTEKPRTKSASIFKEFGPGLVTGAADDDPSGIATYTVAGAQFGLQFLWTAWFTWPLIGFVQMMCAKIVIVSHRSLTKLMLKKFPRRLVLGLIAALFAANTLNVAADLAGMADALRMLTGINEKFFTIALSLLITVMMIRLNYKQIARLLTLLTFFLLAYVFTAFRAEIAWHDVLLTSLHPSLPSNKEGWATLVALLGTTISPYLFFWQASQELEEVNDKKSRNVRMVKVDAIHIRRWDVGVGTFASNLIMFFVILTAGVTLHRAGQTSVQTSTEAAAALKPLLGSSAALFYCLGLLGVGLLAVPTLSGSAAFALADYFKFESGLSKTWNEARSFYAVIIGSAVIALGIDLLGVNPIRALFLSAVVNGLLSPVLLLVVYLIAVDPEIMKGHRISWLSRTIVLLTVCLMTAAGLALFFL